MLFSLGSQEKGGRGKKGVEKQLPDAAAPGFWQLDVLTLPCLQAHDDAAGGEGGCAGRSWVG